LADGDASPTAGTFGDLAAQWIAVKERRWPPNTLQEHRRIVARNLASLHGVDVAKITTRTPRRPVRRARRSRRCLHAPALPARTVHQAWPSLPPQEVRAPAVPA
jgi:hypothetical protein